MAKEKRVVENGIIQPSFGKSQHKSLLRLSVIPAGVLTKDGAPVRQSQAIINERTIVRPVRINPSETEINYIDADAIYFCVPQNHFGHVLTGTMAFAHILLNDNFANHKIVFTAFPPDYAEPSNAIKTLLQHLGVKEENIITVSEYTQFRSVTIVEPSLRCVRLSRFRKRLFEINEALIRTFRAISQKFIDNASPKKVYFSRSKLGDLSVCGEDKIEHVFRQNGYSVFYPEKLSLDEQIKLVANADYYVCVQGTLEHHSLFMKDGSTLIVLNREKNPTERQVLINKLQKKTIKQVYLQTNVRPMGNRGWRYIIGATKDLLRFFDENEFIYDAKMLIPTYEELLAYIHFNLSSTNERSQKRSKQRLKKLLTQHKDFWAQIK